MKSTKPAGKAERREWSDQLVLKAANSAASAGASAEEPSGEGKETRADRTEARDRSEGRTPGLMGCRCGLGPMGKLLQDSRPLWEYRPRRLWWEGSVLEPRSPNQTINLI